MSKFIKENYEELAYNLGSVCCGGELHYESDGTGICGDCKEWSNYLDEEQMSEIDDIHLYI